VATRIACTLGPRTQDVATLEKLLLAGMRVGGCALVFAQCGRPQGRSEMHARMHARVRTHARTHARACMALLRAAIPP